MQGFFNRATVAVKTMLTQCNSNYCVITLYIRKFTAIALFKIFDAFVDLISVTILNITCFFKVAN